MKYQVVEASSASELEKSVRKEIAEGWEPQGGVAVCMLNTYETPSTRACRFYQAMVKETK